MTYDTAVHEKMNLFCFPFSGGSFYSYKPFEKHVPRHIHVSGIDLPGHGRRMREPLLTDIHEMVEDIWMSIKDDLNAPYAIYGHSLGSTLAYLFTLKAIAENKPSPCRLFLSGRNAPSVNKRKNIHLLPKQEFIQKLLQYGGTSKELLQEKDLMEFMVPIMRADFQAVETYTYDRNAPRLAIPLTVMIGLNDVDVTYEEALKWQEVTTWKISVRQFPGGHFFIFDHLPEISRIICQDLAEKN